jgi:hypothetical protein
MDNNLYGALSEYDDAMEDRISTASADQESSGNHLDNSQEGWEDELKEFEEEDDQVDYRETEAEAADCRRKISQGPRVALHQPNMTYAFAPSSVRVTPSLGRGGGTNTRLEIQVGTLPAIPEGVSETTVTEQEGSPESALPGTTPPATEQPESQKTTFIFVLNSHGA